MRYTKTIDPALIDKEKYSVIICKHCHRTLKRYAVGFDTDGKHRKWVDENGKRFNGLTCPRCLAIQLRLIGKKRKDAKKGVNESVQEVNDLVENDMALIEDDDNV
jgi:predicted nucleic-acid-binding Zn-ribbon protein